MEQHLGGDIRGHKMRWTWTDGPTTGETHEHVFHPDGTVEWRSVGPKPAPHGPRGASTSAERPRYAAVPVVDSVSLVSYLASSGYTLTVALNFTDHTMVGFASSAKEWYPVRGTFEVLT